MSACQKHPKFNIKQGVYFRAANPDKPSDWLPNSDVKRQTYYNFAAGGDMDEMAALMGEAQMIHSNESSIGSGFVSAARCPVCLLQTTDPTVKKILALGFNNYYSCNQTRVCWRYSKIQINHPWTDFKYTASDSYDQERTCTRCNQKGKRTAPHNWGEPEERDHVHDDYIYKCKRCKETDCRPYFYD